MCKPLWETGSNASLQSKQPSFQVCTCSPRLLSVSTGKTHRKEQGFQSHHHKNGIYSFLSFLFFKTTSFKSRPSPRLHVMDQMGRQGKEATPVPVAHSRHLPRCVKVLTVLPLFNNTCEDNYKPAFSSLIRAKTCVGASL